MTIIQELLNANDSEVQQKAQEIATPKGLKNALKTSSPIEIWDAFVLMEGYFRGSSSRIFKNLAVTLSKLKAKMTENKPRTLDEFERIIECDTKLRKIEKNLIKEQLRQICEKYEQKIARMSKQIKRHKSKIAELKQSESSMKTRIEANQSLVDSANQCLELAKNWASLNPSSTDGFIEIPIHGFTENSRIEVKDGRIVSTNVFTNWKQKAREMIKKSNPLAGFRRSELSNTVLILKFRHMDNIDTQNLTKSFIDALSESYGINDIVFRNSISIKESGTCACFEDGKVFVKLVLMK